MNYTREQIEACACVMEDIRQLKTADVIHQLLAENDALQSEMMEQCRIIGMSAEREMSLRTEIDALREDAERLLYMSQDMDGFVHVERDKYEYAIECMQEAGRSEPTPDDELNGLRRMIDAARKKG